MVLQETLNRSKVEALDARLAGAEVRFELVKKSLSWKITKPFRAILDTYYAVRNFFQIRIRNVIVWLKPLRKLAPLRKQNETAGSELSTDEIISRIYKELDGE